jgi:UDP:flavonoid glycosyltransferase YjiC (YdhE family)
MVARTGMRFVYAWFTYEAKYFLFIVFNYSRSISESLKRAMPIIVMPFFGDQPSNAALVIYSGTGIKLVSQGTLAPPLFLSFYHSQFSSSCLPILMQFLTGLTKEDVVKSIQYMYDNNATYAKRAEKIALLMKDAGGATKAAEIAEQVVSF